MKRYMVALALLAAAAFQSSHDQALALDCFSFATAEQAQAVLNASPWDPYWLDSDGNGVACDDILGAWERFPENGGGSTKPVREPYTDPQLAQGTPVHTVKVERGGVPIVSWKEDGRIPHVLDAPLMGISMPVVQGWSQYRPGFEGPECFAAEAIAGLESILPPGSVFTAQDGGGHQYWVWTKDESGDRILVNEWLIENGFAVVADSNMGQYLPHKYSDRLNDAQQRAIANRVGLWGAC